MTEITLSRALRILSLAGALLAASCSEGGPTGLLAVSIDGEEVEMRTVSSAEKQLSQIIVEFASDDGRSIEIIADFTRGSNTIACSRVGYIDAKVTYTDADGVVYSNFPEGVCDVRISDGVDDGDDTVSLYFSGELTNAAATVELDDGWATITGLD